MPGANGAVGFLDASDLSGPGLDAVIVDALGQLAPDAVLTVHAPAASEPAVRELGTDHGFEVVMVIIRPDAVHATYALVAGV